MNINRDDVIRELKDLINKKDFYNFKIHFSTLYEENKVSEKYLNEIYTHIQNSTKNDLDNFLKYIEVKKFENELKKGFSNNSSRYFNTLDISQWRIQRLNVIIGENGSGKTNFLKVIRENIVNSLNRPFPKYVVRLLSYGSETENYDPDA